MPLLQNKLLRKHKRNSISQEIKKHEFRVSVFGSARIKKNEKLYKDVFDFAKTIGENGYDIITGGGPGLMEAGNAGHEAGDKDNKADSIGLIIKLPWEPKLNKHLELKKQFEKFSKRLDHFMALSSAVVVMPGGIGTCLELFYTWQLVQVQHIEPIPIILVGKMWKELMKWVEKYPLKNGLISPKDMKVIHIVKDNKEAMKIVEKEFAKFKKKNKRK